MLAKKLVPALLRVAGIIVKQDGRRVSTPLQKEDQIGWGRSSGPSEAQCYMFVLAVTEAEIQLSSPNFK